MGELRVTAFGHASVLFEIQGKRIYADPYSQVCDYREKAPADLILITHNHYDHNDAKAVLPISSDERLIYPELQQNPGYKD